MNNYENIVSQGIDGIIEQIMKAGGFRCEWCAYRDDESCKQSRCRDGIRKFLEAEYEEHDSLDKLRGDMYGLLLSQIKAGTYSFDGCDVWHLRVDRLMRRINDLAERLEKMESRCEYFGLSEDASCSKCRASMRKTGMPCSATLMRDIAGEIRKISGGER